MPDHLTDYWDHGAGLKYKLSYNDAGLVRRITITPFEGYGRQSDGDADYMCTHGREQLRKELHSFVSRYGASMDLVCGCDQVGTLKVLTDIHGTIVKEIEYDSFGVPMTDSFPDLFIPIGFAGGLRDRDTGLVRFGYMEQ